MSISRSAKKQLGAAPNGITFAPDYKRLYVVGRGVVFTFDVGAGAQVSNQKQFSDFMVDGIACRTDGIRTDVFGNLWASSNAGLNVGYSGVTVLEPRRQADRPHPPARGVRECVLRRTKAQQTLHGGRPVALRGVHEYARVVAGVVLGRSLLGS